MIKGIPFCFTRAAPPPSAENQLRGMDDVTHLTECRGIRELDIGENSLDDADGLLAVLEQLPLLQVMISCSLPLGLLV